MKKYVERNQEEFILLCIMAIAAILRFYNIGNLSLTGDEISSLLKLEVDGFAELINGSVRGDFHPALFQVLLYYWAQLFGIGEFAIRVPFAVAGVLSIFYIYQIGSTWFNKTAGLYVAASLTFLIFPLMHSQIARPYSLGLLFSLMSVYYWTLVLFKTDKRLIWNIVGYCFATAASMLTHYFSFFLVFIVAITGVFYMNKGNWKVILACAAFTFLLFSPHFDISLAHVTIGGFREGGWLGPPNLGGNWFWGYLLHCFNESLFMLLLFFAILIFSYLKNKHQIKLNKFHFFSVLWFLTPFLVGYYYSIFRFPVLQKTVLLFSFPFMVILVFSFLRDSPWTKYKTLMLVGFMSFGLFHTVFASNFYQKNHFGVLKEIVLDAYAFEDQYGSDEITKTTNLGFTYFAGYYTDKYNRQINFEEYASGAPEEEKYINQGRGELKYFADILDRSDKPFFMYTWSSKYSPLEIPEMIKDKYPYVIERNYYFNAESHLFGLKPGENQVEADLGRSSMCNFEEGNDDWQGDRTLITNEISRLGSRSYHMTAESEYSLVFTDQVKNILSTDGDELHTSVWAFFPDADGEAILVISLETPEGESYVWRGMNFSYFVEKPQHWTKIYHSWRFDHIRSEDDIIKVYVWNSEKMNYYLDDLEIHAAKGNQIIYGRNNREF